MEARRSSDELLRRPMQRSPSPAGPSPAPLSIRVCQSVFKGNRGRQLTGVKEEGGSDQGGENVTAKKQWENERDVRSEE